MASAKTNKIRNKYVYNYLHGHTCHGIFIYDMFRLQHSNNGHHAGSTISKYS